MHIESFIKEAPAWVVVKYFIHCYVVLSYHVCVIVGFNYFTVVVSLHMQHLLLVIRIVIFNLLLMVDHLQFTQVIISKLGLCSGLFFGLYTAIWFISVHPKGSQCSTGTKLQSSAASSNPGLEFQNFSPKHFENFHLTFDCHLDICSYYSGV